MPTKQTNSGATTGYEAELWAMADALRDSSSSALTPPTTPTEAARGDDISIYGQNLTTLGFGDRGR